MELFDVSLVNWSRGQFALTAMYHWLFVPLTLGLGVIQAIMETIYYKTGNEVWKKITKFWMTLFGINFAIGVATGIILEFQFGTNWSNYSWFVGDIFGAPLAIEGIFAFFMEATFISIMFFGWNKVSKRFHLVSTWLTIVGASLSALWILIANAWMQNPVGMEFNPDTVRNEMVDFWAIVTSPTAINKFLHTVWSSWMVGAIFVVGVSSWYLLKKRELELAKKSIMVASIFGFVATVLTSITGDGSAVQVAKTQPMKLAAMEALWEGDKNAELVAFGVMASKQTFFEDKTEKFIKNTKFSIPSLLSLLSFHDANAYVPGVKNIIEGGYIDYNGDTAISFAEKQAKGKIAIQALADYKLAQSEKNDSLATAKKAELKANFDYFGYGYLESSEDIVPTVPLVFYSFRAMVGVGVLFLLLFPLMWWYNRKDKLKDMVWLNRFAVFSIFLGFLASQSGWIVAELGRQPWTIQDLLPVQAAISSISADSVKITFFMFLVLFTVLLIAELKIMFRQIGKGSESH